VLLSIVGQLGRKAGERAACIKREWRDATAKALGMYSTTVISVATGGLDSATEGNIYSWGGGRKNGEEMAMPELGHGGEETQAVPKNIQAMVGKEVVGVSAGYRHTAVWTDADELFTFGEGGFGKLGHGGQQNESVPRPVQVLAGKKVAGAATAYAHTAVWTDEGELYTFGWGRNGKQGHGGAQSEFVPRLVEALMGKKVVGVAAGSCHMSVWTEAGELFAFGRGGFGANLGHGGGTE